MSTAVAKNPVADIVATIDRPEFQQQLREALPPGLSVEKFTRTTKLAVQLNPEIITADRQSLFLAMVRCAKDGLLPDGREAALVKVKVKGKEQISYWAMVGGLRKIAATHGFSIESHVVYSEDHFEWELGFEPRVDHKPPRLDEDRGQLIGAYAVATGPDGRKYVEVMSKGEIEAIREKSPSARSEWSPWNTSTAEMYRKTPAKRLFKQLPLGQLEEHEARVIQSPEEEAVVEATAVVPALAALPTVDVSEQVEEGSFTDMAVERGLIAPELPLEPDDA